MKVVQLKTLFTSSYITLSSTTAVLFLQIRPMNVKVLYLLPRDIINPPPTSPDTIEEPTLREVPAPPPPNQIPPPAHCTGINNLARANNPILSEMKNFIPPRKPTVNFVILLRLGLSGSSGLRVVHPRISPPKGRILSMSTSLLMPNI